MKKIMAKRSPPTNKQDTKPVQLEDVLALLDARLPSTPGEAQQPDATS